MANVRGKKFEQQFADDFRNTFIEGLVYRLHDQVSGYKVISSNPCDFICYVYPYMFMIECKSIEGNTFNFSGLRQYDQMIRYTGLNGLEVGVVLWFVDHQRVCYTPIDEIIRLQKAGYKSINVKMLNDENFEVYEIPALSKKRVYINSNYSVLLDIANKHFNKSSQGAEVNKNG